MAATTTIGHVTTKERLHQLVDELSEAEADETLRFAAARHKGQNVDEWRDLDAWSDAAMRGSLRELDKLEAAEGFSWDPYTKMSEVCRALGYATSC